MFDIGFWELLIIAIVLLLVMGPERLPEVARQAAFLVRKARQGMFRLKNEMRSEMDGTPFADLQKAKAEMTNFKNDMKQFGRDLADSGEQDNKKKNQSKTQAKAKKSNKSTTKKKAVKKNSAAKKVAKKSAKKITKKASSGKAAKKTSTKKITKKVNKKQTVKKKTNKKAAKSK